VSAILFYAAAVPAPGETAVVDGDEGFHAGTVRRIRIGESLLLSDGAGTVADCVVVGVGKRSISARVDQRRSAAVPNPAVTVVQGIPKSERSELAIELATEAGADEFIAWQAARCVARWEGERAEKGLRRWRAVARSAARQSRRAWIPGVAGPMSTRQLCDVLGDRVAAGASVLVLHESANLPLAQLPIVDATAIVLVVGPEGGISEEEVDALTAVGAAPVRLGPTVLRTSTAAAVALGALGVLTSRWSVGAPKR
jgi:16S rRNA (uracil1498-N3)-methyltransferase